MAQEKTGGRKIVVFSFNQQALQSISYMFFVEDKAMNKEDTIPGHKEFPLLIGLFRQQSKQEMKGPFHWVLTLGNEVQALVFILDMSHFKS